MLRVGLTGGIGSGKSEVSGRLAALGAVVIDADKAAREVVLPGTPGLARIAEAFGPQVLRADGSLDRAGLAKVVFADEAARARLNGIVHPLVHERMREAEAAAVRALGTARGARGARVTRGAPGARATGGGRGTGEGPGVPGTARDGVVVVHDVPLLAEGGRAGDFDLVIVVDVPAAVQLERLTATRGMSQEQARARMSAQATREQRLAVADIVIDNSGTLDDLDRRVAEVWTRLQARARD